MTPDERAALRTSAERNFGAAPDNGAVAALAGVTLRLLDDLDATDTAALADVRRDVRAVLYSTDADLGPAIVRLEKWVGVREST